MSGASLPTSGPLFSYYADDFTGSTDALEALASNGVDTVLFLAPPDDATLRPFRHCRAIGIAGDSRSQSPAWMSAHLPAIFARLREIGAPVVQYKICSTFDSSPEIGSIGRVVEIAREVFGLATVPIVPAAPLLGRYVAFGNMFAADHTGKAIHRLDRHPTMSRHPVTPVEEADLRLHLARQTSLRVGLIDLLALGRSEEDVILPNAQALLFDGLEPRDTAAAAQLLWDSNPAGSQIFAIASSGFTYGMLDYWRAQSWIPAPLRLEPAVPVDRILVLSGSCSPATARQISLALRDDGFDGVPLDPAQTEWPAARAEAIAKLAAGRSVILYSALGPEGAAPLDAASRQSLARGMGRLLRDVIQASGVTRAVVAGGDTSSHAVAELGLNALTYAAPLTRGVPLCRAHGGSAGRLELALKGGQVGSDNFFRKVRSWE